MREESHLDDMRAAIRGDFARLETRRGSQELMQVREREPEAEQGDVVDAVEPPGGTWLARLLAVMVPRQV